MKDKTPHPLPTLLDALLRPRTVHLVGRRGAADLIRVDTKKARRSGPVDLAVIASSSNMAASLDRAAARARAVVVLPVGPQAKAELHDHQAAVLGPGSGVWSPAVAAGIEAAAFRPRERRPTLVVTRSRVSAQHLLRAASGRKLRLQGAICTGGDAGSTSWIDVVEAAAALDPAPVVLVQLQRCVTLADLARVASLEADVVLVLGRPHPLAGLDAPVPDPDQAVAARALGLAVVKTVDQAVEAAFLLGRGVRRGGAVVRAVASNPEETVLLEDGLWRNGVRAYVDPPGARRKSKGSRTATDRVDCLVLGGGPIREDAAVCLTLDGGTTPRPGRAVEATLGALAALQAPRRWRPGQSRRRPRVRVGEARRLLDGWRCSLHELQVKELLGCYGLRGPEAELATSSSGAGRLARDLGFPVAVKAVGPQLRERQTRGMVALDVQNESAVRQAFREVVNACAAEDPSPLLEGVLVSAMVDLPAALDCTLCWSPRSPALLLARSRIAHLSAPPLVLLCPATTEDCLDLAGELLRGIKRPDSGAPARYLARFLSRLSWLGADLDGRMRWLRLDTVSPPTAHTPPLVIDGYGEQLESLRAPQY